MSSTPEGKVKDKVRKALHSMGIYTFPVNQQGIGRRGIPDDFMLCGGQAVFVEYKALCRWDKNNKTALSTLPTVLQILEMDKIRAAGGITYVVDKTNADEFIASFKAGEFYRHRWTMSLDTYEWYRDLEPKAFNALHEGLVKVKGNKPYETIEMCHRAIRSSHQCQ